MEKSHGTLDGNILEMPTQNKEDYFKPIIKTIEGTPFATVERKENEYVIIFGRNMITERTFYSETEAIQWVSLIDWNAILNVIGIYVEEAINNNSKN